MEAHTVFRAFHFPCNAVSQSSREEQHVTLYWRNTHFAAGNCVNRFCFVASISDTKYLIGQILGNFFINLHARLHGERGAALQSDR